MNNWLANQLDQPRHRADPLPYLLIMPVCLGVLLVDLYPFFSAVTMSFQERIQGQPIDPFVGFDNYRTVVADSTFWRSFWTTLKWTAGSVTGQLILGTGLAVLIHGIRRGRRWIAALLLLPWATPVVVAALTWRWILQPDFGVVNSVLSPQWLGLSAGHDWLGDSRTALPVVIAVHIWKYYGFVLIIVLARLTTMPRELFEAARIDGATATSIFWRITAPQLWDVLSVTVLLMVIWTFNTFDVVFLLTGGQASTNLLSIEIWRRFYGSFNFGLAAATAVLMFAALFGVTLAYARRCRW